MPLTPSPASLLGKKVFDFLFFSFCLPDGNPISPVEFVAANLVLRIPVVFVICLLAMQQLSNYLE
jgi:hypothetical protein